MEARLKSPGNVPVALGGGGEMGERIRSLDWTKTSLGHIAQWPKTLYSALSICINSNFPIAIYWGDDLVLVYNDPWSPIPGNKHPWALGKPAKEVWPEIWGDIEPQFIKAFNGIPGGSKDALLPMQRHGYTEECYFDFTFTPIYGETGKVEGVFNAVIETTYRFINERRAATLQRLANAINSISRTADVIEKASQVLGESKVDIPFYSIYKLSSDQSLETLAKSHGLDTRDGHWPIKEIVASGQPKLLSNVDVYISSMPVSHWPEPVTEAFITPLTGIDGKVFGFIVLGISPRRRFDKDYELFCQSVTTILNGELNTIQALEVERSRSENLAEIDRAKTIFFSNISHEFRTPLTLMLGPLEEVLDKTENLTEEQKGNIETCYRSTLRLQKLVNTLLDFSRLEAGRIEVCFEKIDISRTTEDLVSSFRSAIENAGLNFYVKAERIAKPVYVDVDMWEKIVLNLVSNAFKYTKRGTIEVSIKQVDNKVQFAVSDTGVGISIEDQSKIFERFYRVNNSEGRSQEGTGIGLAMVRELVHLHQGEIYVESTLGAGSRFIVEIPLGKQQNHDEKTSQRRSERGNHRNNIAYLQEANAWVGNTSTKIAGRPAGVERRDSPVVSKPKILVADDNSDMRNYLYRILQNDYIVEAVVDGDEAYRVALEWNPDLILSDIMMPKLDGFSLLKKLKGNLSSRNIPIIFLSARAGEEARIEGIVAGADDYLTKPFSSKELLARVANHIAISNARRRTEKEFFNLFLQSPAHIHVMKGPDHVFEFFHPLGIPFAGRDITGMKAREALPQVEGQGFFEMLDKVYHEGTPVSLKEAKAILPNAQGEPAEHYFNITYLPWKDLNGHIQGVLQFTFEVTELVKERQKAEASEQNLRSVAEQAPVAICVLKGPNHTVQIVNDRVLEIWDRSYDKVIDRPIAEVLPEIVSQGLITLLDNVYNTGKPFSGYEMPVDVVRHGKLERIYFNFIYQPFLNPVKKVDGIIVVALDVTEQVRSREVIEEAQYKLKNAVELAELGTWNINLKNNFVDYSQRVAEWWGLSEEGSDLDTVIACMHPDDRGRVSAAVAHAINVTGYYEAEYRLYNAKTKQERFIQANGRVFHDDNNVPIRVSGIVRDLTFYKMTQQELEKQVQLRTAELVGLNNDLIKSNENLRQFAYVASHDLQEPLRKIQTFSDMVKDNLSDENYVRTFIAKIDNSAARMSALIKDVLLYSQITNDDNTVESVDLNEVLANVKSDFELLVEQKKATINSTTLPIVKGKKLHFYQLFSNLVGNSLKFSEDPPVVEISCIETDGDEIPEDLRRFKHYHRLQFNDNGIGFEEEYAEHIFGLFTRLHNRKDYAGTGIGLALCKKIVESRGGYISAKSKKGAGSTFIILLPIE